MNKNTDGIECTASFPCVQSILGVTFDLQRSNEGQCSKLAVVPVKDRACVCMKGHVREK